MSHTSPSEPPIDLQVLPDLTGCDDAMRDEFLADFRVTASESRDMLRQAMDAGDAAALASAAHRIKSSARYMGAMPLGQMSERLEQAGERADLDGARALLAQWHSEWQRVDGFIAGHLGLG
ncbi:Hpt domain-containing protein [Ideonella sp. DXS22W]|uniref:Hpt domain-containing protein n=1 Tax=Pseudaquabacterium inlustre TaxID=2984192 RepID=A0ABU9C9Y0_9BURK